MAKSSRRASRIRAKQRRRAEHERAGNRRRFLRRLTIVGVGAAALLLVSGVAWEWASSSASWGYASGSDWLGSTAVGASEPSLEESETGYPVSRLPLSEEKLRERWERLSERRRQLEHSMSESVRRGGVVSPLTAGSSAVELPEAMRVRVVPAREQLEMVAREYPILREQMDRALADLDRREQRRRR